MDDWKIDIHNEVYLTQWNKEWARTFHLEKQGIMREATPTVSGARIDMYTRSGLLLERVEMVT